MEAVSKWSPQQVVDWMRGKTVKQEQLTADAMLFGSEIKALISRRDDQ